MCVGIPLQVVECDEQVALCEADGRRERLNVLLIGAQPAGTWVLSFQGSAIRVLSVEEAQQTRSALAALSAAHDGHTDLDQFFADLLGREPALPVHLQIPPKESQA
jgi:hydrogenase expression/formation protein HypC